MIYYSWNDYPLIGTVCQAICGAACLVGILRMIRRFARPEMRVISSPDDYFSIILLNVWLGAGVFGLAAGAPLLSTGVFYAITTFFLVYVPFSKISHYLYYPFNKWYVGKHLGHRGVYPKNRPVVTHYSEGTASQGQTVAEQSRANA